MRAVYYGFRMFHTVPPLSGGIKIAMKNSTLCYIEKDGKYLMLHRVKKKNDENSGKWIGIGGKFLENESPYDCVRRECLEETGLFLEKPIYRGLVSFTSDEYETEQMHLFLCREFKGELTDCDEGELEWVEKSRIPELKLWSGDMLFLSMLGKDVPFFNLKLSYKGESLVYAELDGIPMEL